MTQSRTTIARPYAKAAFRFAQEQQAFDQWHLMLESLAITASDVQVRKLLLNPSVQDDQLIELFIEVNQQHLDQAGQNFVQLLAERHRLGLLPEIRELYSLYVAESQRRAKVLVKSAHAFSEQQQTQLKEALKKKLEHDIDIDIQIDPKLLAGAVVRCGDLVIDGSLQGRLRRLVNDLVR